MSQPEHMSSARKPSPAHHRWRSWQVRFQRWQARSQQWFAYVDDRINPIVVKELRQAVRGRFLSLMMIVFLLLQLLMLGATLMRPSVRETAWAAANAGSDYFRTLLLILLGTCLLFIPVYTAVRLAMERSEQNTDLIFISTLSPRSIVAGKFFASVLFTILLFSASAPFMAVSYLLRGIDFPTIILLIGFAFCVIVLCIQLGLFTACVTSNRFIRFVVGIGFLAALGGAFLMVVEVSKMGIGRGLGGQIKELKFWLASCCFAVFASFAFVLLSRMTVAMISPPSLNRARPVRRMYSFGWLCSGLICWGLCYLGKTFVYLYTWQVFHVGFLSIAFFVVVVERERLGPRLAREIPRSTLRRLLVFPHFSGLANGLFWGVLLLCGTLLLPYMAGKWQGWMWAHGSDFFDTFFACAGVGLFAFAYAATGLLVHRALLFKKVARRYVWVVGLVIAALCVALPLLLMLLSLKSKVPETWLILTPLALFWKSTRGATAAVALIWALVALLGVMPILLQQFFGFYPPVETYENARRSARGNPVRVKKGPVKRPHAPGSKAVTAHQVPGAKE